MVYAVRLSIDNENWTIEGNTILVYPEPKIKSLSPCKSLFYGDKDMIIRGNALLDAGNGIIVL